MDGQKNGKTESAPAVSDETMKAGNEPKVMNWENVEVEKTNNGVWIQDKETRVCEFIAKSELIRRATK